MTLRKFSCASPDLNIAIGRSTRVYITCGLVNRSINPLKKAVGPGKLWQSLPLFSMLSKLCTKLPRRPVPTLDIYAASGARGRENENMAYCMYVCSHCHSLHCAGGRVRCAGFTGELDSNLSSTYSRQSPCILGQVAKQFPCYICRASMSSVRFSSHHFMVSLSCWGISSVLGWPCQGAWF